MADHQAGIEKTLFSLGRTEAPELFLYDVTSSYLEGQKNFFGAYWKETIEFLARNGFRVVVPAQIGFGKSAKPDIHYSFHLLAANTKQLLDHLGINTAPEFRVIEVERRSVSTDFDMLRSALQLQLNVLPNRVANAHQHAVLHVVTKPLRLHRQLISTGHNVSEGVQC